MKIITYREMCNQEGVETIQRGMNFSLGSNYSVILMSVKKAHPVTTLFLMTAAK